jgi:hypothetical protein
VGTLYRVVELGVVTDATIERELNKCTAEGWQFDSVHFVVRDNSRRPSMAFLFFVRPEQEETQTQEQ